MIGVMKMPSIYSIPPEILKKAQEIQLRGETIYKCNYYSLLDLDEEYGLTLDVYAIAYKKSWKEPEIKKAFVVQEKRWLINSDMYFTNMGGWNIVWSKTKKKSGYWYYYYDTPHPLDELYEREYEKNSYPPNVCVENLWDYNDLVKLVPEAKYLTEYPSDIVKFISLWRKHPQIEVIYKNPKTRHLWTDTRLWNLGNEKQKEVIPWLLKGYSLNDALGKVKYRSDEEMERVREKNRIIRYIDKNIHPYNLKNDKRVYYKLNSDQKLKIYKYINTNKLSTYEYDDYLTCCLQLKRNLKDYGVLFPKQFKEQHDTCAALVNEVLRKKEANKKTRRNNAYVKAAKKLCEAFKECLYSDGKFEMKVPESMMDLVEIGDKLEICVGAASYDKKVVSGKSIIVVIYLNGKPLECCEIAINKKKLSLAQLRGKRNRDSKYHSECEEIINNFIPIAQTRLYGGAVA